MISVSFFWNQILNEYKVWFKTELHSNKYLFSRSLIGKFLLNYRSIATILKGQSTKCLLRRKPRWVKNYLFKSYNVLASFINHWIYCWANTYIKGSTKKIATWRTLWPWLHKRCCCSNSWCVSLHEWSIVAMLWYQRFHTNRNLIKKLVALRWNEKMGFDYFFFWNIVPLIYFSFNIFM